MQGSKSANKAEKAHMDAVRELGCIVCREEMAVHSPAAIHHIVEGGRRLGHDKVLPLCYLHHQGGENGEAYVSRHPHKAAFEERYGTEYELLEKVEAML